MVSKSRNPSSYFSAISARQNGVSLLIFVLVILIAASTILLSVLDSADIKNERDKKVWTTLTLAKTALIGYATTQSADTQRPGDLIRPDALSTFESPPNYDGQADTGCLDFSKSNGLPLITTGTGMRCLGRLPWKDLGIYINAPSENDSTGVMPWYAVSANLVDPTCVVTLNSNISNLPYSGVCSSTSLGHKWLTVRDRRGNILSDKVAAVIFIPGSALANQLRSLSPNLGGAAQYLDRLEVLSGCNAPCLPGVYNNANMNEDFILSSENTADASASTSNFNDKLVYITVDELMAAVEKRVAQEAKSQLKAYYANSSASAANRFYPYAAKLEDSNNACSENLLTGKIPILPALANCTSGSVCSASFPIVKKVEFTLTAGVSYTSKSGACNRLSNICTCTGAGSCSKSTAPTYNFTCDAVGNCSSSGASPNGSFVFTYNAKNPDISSVSGSCSGGNGTVSCSGSGAFSSPPSNCSHPTKGIGNLPSWFTDNNWQDFMYYAISDSCRYSVKGCAGSPQLKVGTKTNINAIIISAGKQLSATQITTDPQIRPSVNLDDYLDSDENTNGDSIYDPIGKPRTNQYNDQMLIISQ